MIRVGQPCHPIGITGEITPRYQQLAISCGQRLSCMSLDSSRIVANTAGIYDAGEIVIAIDTGVVVTITLLTEDGRIEIVEHQASRALLVRHGVGLMRAALGVHHGLHIELEMRRPMPHCGLGTSSLVVAVVAIAMNELYGCPVADDVLARYLAQNHGEEVAGIDGELLPVQCLGGSGVANLFDGALQVMAGETTIIATMRIPETYRVVIGVPVDTCVAGADVSALMHAEGEQAAGFAETGQRYASRVAFDLVHEGLPSMARQDLSGIGRIVFNHRFNWGSIRNCRFSHPRLLEIADGLRPLFEVSGAAAVLGLSSAGPAFYAVTKDVEICRRAFEMQGLATFTTPLFNDRYRVIASEAFHESLGLQHLPDLVTRELAGAHR